MCFLNFSLTCQIFSICYGIYEICLYLLEIIGVAFANFSSPRGFLLTRKYTCHLMKNYTCHLTVINFLSDWLPQLLSPIVWNQMVTYLYNWRQQLWQLPCSCWRQWYYKCCNAVLTADTVAGDRGAVHVLQIIPKDDHFVSKAARCTYHRTLKDIIAWNMSG